jgi:hypothetical protein
MSIQRKDFDNITKYDQFMNKLMSFKIWCYIFIMSYCVVNILREPSITSFVVLVIFTMVIITHYNIWEYFLKKQIKEIN